LKQRVLERRPPLGRLLGSEPESRSRRSRRWRVRRDGGGGGRHGRDGHRHMMLTRGGGGRNQGICAAMEGGQAKQTEQGEASAAGRRRWHGSSKECVFLWFVCGRVLIRIVAVYI